MGNIFVLGNMQHEVAPWITGMFVLLLIGLIVCLALEEKLHAKKSVIAGCFALIALLLAAMTGILPFDKVVIGSHLLAEHEILAGKETDHEGRAFPVTVDPVDDPEDLRHAEVENELVHLRGHRVDMPVYVPGVDWAVIAIILGSSLFVDVTSKSGLFTWIAIKLTKTSRGDPLVLLILYGLMTVLFSAVLNNVTAMIIVGSLTAVSLEKLGRTENLLGFLLVEGLLTNIGGLLTLISSVPNILVGTAAGIDFMTFFIKSSPYVLIATAVTLALGAWKFSIQRLVHPDEQNTARELVNGFDENDGIESVAFFRFSAVMLVAFIVAIATTSVTPGISDLQMGFVAVSFAAIMLLRYKSVADEFYRNLDWDLLGFFIALFVFIYVIEFAQVLALIGNGLEWMIASCGKVGGSAAVLLAAAGFSSVTDNIPLAAMLSKILTSLGTPDDSRLWWSVIFGANLGGNLTPIGSASTLVAVTIIHRHKLQLSFAGFVAIALPFAVVQILLATAYVLLVL